MPPPGRKPATYQQIEELPECFVGEMVDGELIASPRPASRHALAASVLAEELIGPFQRRRGGPGGWWILVEPELHLANDVLVPDLAGWRRERMPVLPDVPFFSLAPDWLCEVLSPRTARLDLQRKLPKYAEQGVAHAWLVNPEHRTLEVFRREPSGRFALVQAFGEDDGARAEPFEAVELELEALWDRGDPGA